MKLYDAFKMLNINFNIKNANIKKFRDDLDKTIFILNNSVIKTKNNESVDIILGYEMIKIKSVSSQKKNITISRQQIEENTTKCVVLISVDSKEKNIIEIMNEISDKEFGKELVDTYKGTLFDSTKYNTNTIFKLFKKYRDTKITRWNYLCKIYRFYQKYMKQQIKLCLLNYFMIFKFLF